ncbi:hypothetical protein CY0110_31365 [Crocosphaera chwakensis CCY0110]|uniref:Uncharacterized protein n=1 Tax=Crocosphaera chwakensis CCY0110 TaxID=391612 RepID=A3IY20_9CHRO|nr:hypothetical protein CY0110_31365 [Crocosphaera chwakensis CCY0110]
MLFRLKFGKKCVPQCEMRQLTLCLSRSNPGGGGVNASINTLLLSPKMSGGNHLRTIVGYCNKLQQLCHCFLLLFLTSLDFIYHCHDKKNCHDKKVLQE